jgi:hypothetical protein
MNPMQLDHSQTNRRNGARVAKDRPADNRFARGSTASDSPTAVADLQKHHLIEQIVRDQGRPSPRTRRRHRRKFVLFLLAAVAIGSVIVVHRLRSRGDSFPIPAASTLSGLSTAQRVVAIAKSQVGYTTQPSDSYCNKYSAFWSAGSGGCPSGELSEEWCADFAAWAWRQAGVSFSYGFGPGDIDAGAVSFYEWGIANGAWHSATSGFVPSPGDVAVYGLTLGATPAAAHVAIVTADPLGQAGPNVVNGDGDQTGFSVVETQTDQQQVRVGQVGYQLAGYVSLP